MQDFSVQHVFTVLTLVNGTFLHSLNLNSCTSAAELFGFQLFTLSNTWTNKQIIGSGLYRVAKSLDKYEAPTDRGLDVWHVTRHMWQMCEGTTCRKQEVSAQEENHKLWKNVVSSLWIEFAVRIAAIVFSVWCCQGLRLIKMFTHFGNFPQLLFKYWGGNRLTDWRFVWLSTTHRQIESMNLIAGLLI